ncbi:Clavaminate synthase-like protein [Abortiporus biennis]|nr:Clavaminate synthase-like protein [Abortiporus biennis]
MSTSSLPHIPHYVPAPATKEDLEYADLAIIDLSKASTPEGKAALAIEARDAMRDKGFFYVINHGWTQEQNDRIFDIADVPFSQVPEDEKKQYDGKMLETSSFQGYKLRQYWEIENGVQDQLEHYNINRDITKKQHPEAVRPLLPEIQAFAKHNHFDVLFPILRLLAIGLELPEDTFVNHHGFEAVGETYVRFMKYYPRSEEEEQKTNQVWLKGHTDFGSITILWSQPVSSLQILSKDGKWRFIKHIDNALVINAGDALEFLSGGYYKATIHRVIQPPKDQRGHTRVGAFYFVMPDDDVKLIPLEKESPVLQRVGVERRCKDEDAPTTEQWRKGRTKAYGKSNLKKVDGGKVEEEYINGVLVKHYS